jgi:hypothetical protein
VKKFGDSIVENNQVEDIRKSRLDKYTENHCWQYDIRLKNLKDDLFESNLTEDCIKNLKVSDFLFKRVEDLHEKRLMRKFIERHEWLGNISRGTTHYFACYYRKTLAGVILLNVPNAYSKMLGENTRDLERLISRGACISWSPKNLASSFLMWCIHWMVKNTPYRLFTAYSDPTAKEIGTIYQACNFFYLGKNSGEGFVYIHPDTKKIVSGRYFTVRASYKKYASELGFKWQSNWMSKTQMLWRNIPKEVEIKLRDFAKKKKLSAEKIPVGHKHKYAYVIGSTKKETKELKKLFLERNKVHPYPKERGK